MTSAERRKQFEAAVWVVGVKDQELHFEHFESQVAFKFARGNTEALEYVSGVQKRIWG